jgi:Transglycosylase
MKALIRFIKYFSMATLVMILIGYNAFVIWRNSKLPEDKTPSTAQFSGRIQSIYWHTVFGSVPMKMEPYPFWKVLINLPLTISNNGKMPNSFNAASVVSKHVILARSPEQQTRSIDWHLNQLFAAIWVSKHWSAEDVVNTILESAYFCHEFHGIEAASMGFYGHPANELTIEELIFRIRSGWPPSALP